MYTQKPQLKLILVDRMGGYKTPISVAQAKEKYPGAFEILSREITTATNKDQQKYKQSEMFHDAR